MENEKTNVKTRLFQKAMVLFREHGYDNVTIRQICKEANVTRNAFYYYFDSKEALVSSYFDNIPDFTQSLLTDILALPNDWEKLWYLYESHLKQIENEGFSICRAFLKINIDGKGDILYKYYVSDIITLPLLINCQSSGLVRNKMEPDKLIYLATRMIAGILMTWCSKNGDFDLINNAKEAFINLMQPAL